MSLALLAPLLALAAGEPSATARGLHVTASLAAERAWIQPGRAFSVALRLQMDPEWHTYWKNPGDSGLPTRIRWTLPAGFEAGPIAWPSPERFATGPLASYGYDGEVLLVSELRPPARASSPGPARASSPGPADDAKRKRLPSQAPSPAVIAARVDWLECRDVCRPGRAELALRLEVKDEEPPPDGRWARAFADARARLPRERGWWSLAATAGQRVLILSAQGRTSPPREAYFFPGRPDLVEHGEAQPLTAEKGGFRLRIPMSANAKPPASLDGVLLADGVGFEVSAPIRPVSRGGAR